MADDVVIVEEVHVEDEGSRGDGSCLPNSHAADVHGSAPAQASGNEGSIAQGSSKASVFDRLSLPKDKGLAFGEVSILQHSNDSAIPKDAPSYASKLKSPMQNSKKEATMGIAKGNEATAGASLVEVVDITSTLETTQSDQGGNIENPRVANVINSKDTQVMSSHDSVVPPNDPPVVSTKEKAKTPAPPVVKAKYTARTPGHINIPSVIKAFSKSRHGQPLGRTNPFSVLMNAEKDGRPMHGLHGDVVVKDVGEIFKIS
ncbi:hypothetical protein L6452_43610 [Arctium lappa]|uniref:Uncharacterized protein n=1 Tax=Arctium lappa TaxID=4217 RepID=A0ACB8XEM3_ARCLA|nr:hypothetical protein L6452_43610 [Arctium lappa]